MMDATGRARRSDALFYDDVTMHRRDLCDLVALRESRVEELREELAGLRGLIGEVHAAYVGAIGLYEYDRGLLISEDSLDEEAEAEGLRRECEGMRHRFDDALREAGIEVSE